MAYYDSIAEQWHQATGYQGGAFKKYVLNELLLALIESIQGKAILEVGCGNGYFMAWVCERCSGQMPRRLVISDISSRLLALAQQHFSLSFAEYQQLDLRGRFEFPDAAFDLVIATMVFNELTDGGAKRALAEISRVLGGAGVLLLTVTHPDFVRSLARREALKRSRQGLLTMPAAKSLRLPVVPRARQKYEQLLVEAGFEFKASDVLADDRVLKEKSGLQISPSTPLGLVFQCWKKGVKTGEGRE